MKRTQAISVQFPIPPVSLRASDWAGWKRALELLWKASKAKSWGYVPVAVRITFDEGASPERAVVVLDALKDTGIIMDWRTSVQELKIVKRKKDTPLPRVVIEIERYR